MGLETYQVARDHFEPDDNTHLTFPCCACRHRHGTDQEEPCIRCDWNLCAKPDDELLSQKIEVVSDHVAEKLDEMADLCEYWTRNRVNGRNPTAVRAALLLLAAEVTAMTSNAEFTGGR